MAFDIKDVTCQILLKQFTVAPIYKNCDVLILVLLSINYIVIFTSIAFGTSYDLKNCIRWAQLFCFIQKYAKLHSSPQYLCQFALLLSRILVLAREMVIFGNGPIKDLKRLEWCEAIGNWTHSTLLAKWGIHNSK